MSGVVPADKDERHRWLAIIVRASIAYQIRVLRMTRGWTQAELAERAKRSTQTISRLEDASGEDPQMNTLLAVANALDVALMCRFTSWPDFVTSMAGLIPPAAFDADHLQDADDIGQQEPGAGRDDRS